jgi:hypothetical protein
MLGISLARMNKLQSIIIEESIKECLGDNLEKSNIYDLKYKIYNRITPLFLAECRKNSEINLSQINEFEIKLSELLSNYIKQKENDL